MESEKRYLYVSYARADSEIVQELVDVVRMQLRIRAVPVDVWIDANNIMPGESFDVAISQALEASVGLLFFISPNSLTSEWALKELEMAMNSPDRLLIPVLLGDVVDLPESLRRVQWLDLSGIKTKEEIFSAGKRIVIAVADYLEKTPTPQSPVSKVEAEELAAQFANEMRVANEPASGEESKHSVFLVHGHNLEALSEVEDYLKKIGITPVVLSRLHESAQSLFQKFISVAGKARFAVVLLSSDDYGASRRQYETEGVADKSLQFRARQNVILELGFFYGKLGWENVHVIYRNPDEVFPNFEMPSDLGGVVFDAMNSVSWKRNLEDKLRDADIVFTSSF